MRAWLRWGCLIVVILIGVVVLWGAVTFGTALIKTYGEEVVTDSFHQEVAGPGASVAGQPDGRVVLNLFVGEFTIEDGEPGDGIRVEAEYDENSYELTESFEPSPDGPWTYRIDFRQTGLFRDSGLRALLGGAFPRIVIKLPPDVPLALEGNVGMGGTNLNLGGLWLTEVDVNAQKGGCLVGFDKPTAAPLNRLAIRAKQGGLVVAGIANAGPRKVEISHSMGGMSVDLRGEWHLDSDIRIKSSMGGSSIVLPETARIEWTEGGKVTVEGLKQPEEPAPTLRMSVTKWIGPIQIHQF